MNKQTQTNKHKYTCYSLASKWLLEPVDEDQMLCCVYNFIIALYSLQRGYGNVYSIDKLLLLLLPFMESWIRLFGLVLPEKEIVLYTPSRRE